MPEPVIVRRSNVWGELLSGRHWRILPDPLEEFATGFCAFDDMIGDGSVAHAIPSKVLSASDHKRGKKWTEYKEDNEGTVLYFEVS